MIKELELEAKERQQKAAKEMLEKRWGSEKQTSLLPQKSGEATLYDEPESYYPERRRVDSPPAPAKATTHTATTKATEKEKKKHDGESAEQAAKLLGTNRDYVSKMKKLEDTTAPSRPAKIL